MARIVVTGAAGYVGGRLVAHLRTGGHDVVPVVRRPVAWVDAATVADLATADDATLDAVVAGSDAVIHLAGASEVRAVADPDGALFDTVVGTRRVGAAAARTGVARLVYASTVHVYGPVVGGVPAGPDGDASPLVLDESTPIAPVHPYAIARATGEWLTRASGVAEPVVVRLANLVGAPVDRAVDRWSLVANELCAAAATGGPLVLRSAGLQWRDFVAMGTACRQIEAAASTATAPGTFHIASGRPSTVRALADRIAALGAVARGEPIVVEAPAADGPPLRPVALRAGGLDDASGSAATEDAASALDRELQATIELCAGISRA